LTTLAEIRLEKMRKLRGLRAARDEVNTKRMVAQHSIFSIVNLRRYTPAKPLPSGLSGLWRRSKERVSVSLAHSHSGPSFEILSAELSSRAMSSESPDAGVERYGTTFVLIPSSGLPSLVIRRQLTTGALKATKVESIALVSAVL
jgi:hypothetical protein